jgi:hypothetical protein
MSFKISTKYYTGEVEMIRDFYLNGNRSFRLVEFNSGAPVMTPTVNVGQDQPHDIVAIKGWSENEGIQDALITAGVIGPILGTIPCGYAVATMHEFLL